MTATQAPIQLDGLRGNDVEAFLHTTNRAFGGELRAAEVPFQTSLYEPDRLLAAYDGGTMVATAGAFTFEMMVPGTVTRVAGVTEVGVIPTHRRRGILRTLMRRQLDDVRDRGEAVAALWASEAGIYGRFGYGLSGWRTTLDLDTREARVRDDALSHGQVRILGADEAAVTLPQVYDVARRQRPGMFARTDARWRAWLVDHEHRREGAGPQTIVVYEDAQGLAGYVIYRVKQDWSTGTTAATVDLKELCATDLASTAALWRYVLSIDLVRSVTSWNRPLDDPLVHLLVDPRQAKRRLSDSLWVRLVDVPTALATRRYSTSGRVVLDVHDEFCPWNSGRYSLTGDTAQATCEPTSDSADLRLSATELGAAYLGDVSLSTLAASGRVAELREGALRTADAMFRWSPGSWCPEVF